MSYCNCKLLFDQQNTKLCSGQINLSLLKHVTIATGGTFIPNLPMTNPRTLEKQLTEEEITNQKEKMDWL